MPKPPFDGRKPDYIIKAMDKVTNEKGTIGAAWANPNGTISIRFQRFVTVPVGAEFVITAFPRDEVNDGKEQD